MKPCGRQWEEMEQGGPYTWTCNDYGLCEMCKYKQKVKDVIKGEYMQLNQKRRMLKELKLE